MPAKLPESPQPETPETETSIPDSESTKAQVIDTASDAAQAETTVVWLFRGHPDREFGGLYTIDAREAGRAKRVGRARVATDADIAAAKAGNRK